MSILSRLIDRRIAVYQQALVQTHYAEVENMYRQMRGWRHDFRNHIQAMKALAASGDLAVIAAYLEQLDTDLAAVEPAIKTGNRMADAILNSKIALARAQRVPVTAEAQIAVALTTPELDLCIIIGNLFDNAIEANLALPEEQRMLRVFMEMKQTQLYMSFTNRTAARKRGAQEGRFATTKGEGHGFGLLRVDAIVERHGGYIRRASEDGAFSTEVLLPQ